MGENKRLQVDGYLVKNQNVTQAILETNYLYCLVLRYYLLNRSTRAYITLATRNYVLM